jgi:thymidylate synthase (FAD)
MKVELLSHFGDDLMVVNAARVSFGKSKEEFDNKDAKLIKYLYDHKHTSVFRHPQLQFRITCPIYVERQMFKHQIGMSANSISGRYVDFSDSYTKIETWREQSKSSKQGSANDLNLDTQVLCNEIQDEVIDFCKNSYENLLALGVSKEQARTILPLNLNTTYIWTGSLLSFVHLFNLRLKDDAQKETRIVADLMLQDIKRIKGNPFCHSLAAFGLSSL